MSQAMIYSAIFNMMVEPESYEGKSIRLHGKFTVYEHNEDGKIYRNFACVVTDPQACCEQGLIFSLTEDKIYPDDYPEKDSLITIRGILTHQQKDDYDSYELSNSVIEYQQ